MYRHGLHLAVTSGLYANPKSNSGEADLALNLLIAELNSGSNNSNDAGDELSDEENRSTMPA